MKSNSEKMTTLVPLPYKKISNNMKRMVNMDYSITVACWTLR